MCAKTQNFVQIIILMVSIFLKEADVSNMGGGSMFVCLSACLAPVND
jgi:hypothetical protein